MDVDITQLTPEEFEKEIFKLFEEAGNLMHACNVSHREVIKGTDGNYEIDIVVRFESFGVQFTVLVECKHHKNPIKREVVQVLHDRVRSTGAHKGIIFSMSPYQRGAIEYAKAHGIALFQAGEKLLRLAANTGEGRTIRYTVFKSLTLYMNGKIQVFEATPKILRGLLKLEESY